MSERQSVLGQLSIDIIEYIENDYKMDATSKIEAIRAIFEKHYMPLKSELTIGRKEFEHIVSNAKSEYTKGSATVNSLKKPLEPQETANYYVISSFIGFLNSKNALLRMPQFKLGDK